MNFLNGCYISKCSQRIWRNSCCLDSQALLAYYFEKKGKVCKKSMTIRQPNYQCKLITSKKNLESILWQQVRYKYEYPKLHRDYEHPNFDAYRKDKFKDLKRTAWQSGDDKKGYTNMVGFFGLLCGFYGAKSELTHFLTSMSAAADVRALAFIEIDIGNVAPGNCLSYKWRGKPLFIKHRTPAEISAEANTPLSALKDPETPDQRTVKPEWLVVVGICTHLGCVPVPNSGDWAGGFYCPCHGSHYDNVGRARKGPAPLNLEVPPHKFISDTLILVG